MVGDLKKCNGYHHMSISNEYLPVAISFPHFMHAKRLQDAIDGLSPDYNDHQSYFTIDPYIGVTIEAQIKLQVNVFVHPAASVEGYNNFKPTLMPYLWMVESGKMSSDDRNFLFNIINTANIVGNGLCLSISVIGLLMLLWSIINCRKQDRTKNEDYSERNLTGCWTRFCACYKNDDDYEEEKEEDKKKSKKSTKMKMKRKQIFTPNNNNDNGSANSLNQILPGTPISTNSHYSSIYHPGDKMSQKSISLNSIRFNNNNNNNCIHKKNNRNIPRSLTPID